MNATLLILAAGMGSRYGGLKQIDQLGPNGETIIDYSVQDAIKAGFNKIIFVIRKNIEQDFKEVIIDKYKSRIEVDYVFQELDALPAGFSLPPHRIKPWGTGHAILMAKDKINSFFSVINGDDYYGEHAFKTMVDFFSSLSFKNDTTYSMAGYRLSKTLSDNGVVSRGVCEEDENHFLIKIKEYTRIERKGDKIVNLGENDLLEELNPDSLVSMNFWGFHPSLFVYLEELFVKFLEENIQNDKSEFYIPFAIDDLIKANKINVKVLQTHSEWFGVTYQEDKKQIMEKLKEISK